MKIKTQIFLVGLLMSILPMALVSAILISLYNVELERMAIDNLRSITAAQTDIIDNFFKERDVNLSMFGDYAMLQNLFAHRDEMDSVTVENNRATMEEIFRGQKSKKDFIYSITAIDKDLHIVASTEPVEPGYQTQLGNMEVLNSLGHDIWFSHILDAGEFGTRDRCLVAVKVIYNNEDEHVGYIVEEVALNFFENLRVTTKLIEEGSVYITDGNGGLITAGVGDENRQGQDYVLRNNQRDGFTEAWKNRDQNETIGVMQYKIGGKSYLTSYGGFENSEWQILSTVCMDDILHTQDTLFQVLLIAAVAAGLLIIAINLIMRYMLSVPIERMVKTFAKIREKEDFSMRIENIPNNEIGIIAKEVNDLLEDIKNRIDEQEEKLVYLKERAARDPLTNLFNKTTTKEIFSIKIDNARVDRRTLACILVDIDDFKDYNTKYGHSGGDKVIRFISTLIREMSLDNGGRIGGDEFVMCLDFGTTRQDIESFIIEFIRRLHEGVDIEGNGIAVSIPCSIGAALRTGRSRVTYESMMELADKAMYHVKNSSKDGYCIFHQSGDTSKHSNQIDK